MKPRKSRKGTRYTNVLFWAPVALVVVLVAVALLSVVQNQSSTVVIRAYSSGRYSPQISLRVTFAVGSATGFTPSNLTLAQGFQTIRFGTLPWYVTPAPRNFYLPGGKTYFATGIYNPVLAVFSISSSGLNTTSVTALHGVTPVLWLNQGSSSVVLQFQDGRQVQIRPSQNYTQVFNSAGVYTFRSPAGDLTGEVDVQ